MIDPKEVDYLRSIPLKTVLIAEGADLDRNDKSKWHTVNGNISITNQKFYNWFLDKGGYGAIDLMRQLRDVDFVSACKRLSLLQGKNLTKDCYAAEQRSFLKKLTLPKRDDSKYMSVLRYLCVNRKLPIDSVRQLLADGIIYPDIYSNAVFLLLGKGKKPIGAELKGTQATPWCGVATGTSKELGFFYTGETSSKIAILCESAIDALSCLLFHPNAQCISTAGAYSTTKWLPMLLQSKSQVYCGYDNDAKGETMYRGMKRLFPEVQRVMPTNKDWNEDIILIRH